MRFDQFRSQIADQDGVILLSKCLDKIKQGPQLFVAFDTGIGLTSVQDIADKTEEVQPHDGLLVAEFLCNASIHLGLDKRGSQRGAETEHFQKWFQEIWVKSIGLCRVKTRNDC